MSCSKMKKLRFDARMAEVEAEDRHSTRRFVLESNSPSNDPDGHLSAFMEEDVVEAEMKRTRTRMAVDQHAHNCLFCSRANSN
jgi:hypothetical protein